MADDPTTPDSALALDIKPDSALALDIKEVLTDRAGPEVLAVTLGNVPPGALLSAGADNGDGTWSLALADLEGLAITPPPGWTGEINMVVSALTKSGDAATPTTTAFGISVMPAGAEAPPPPFPDQAPDQAPEPALAPEPGGEPSGEPLAFALEIDTGLGDGETAEDVAVIISGMPAGAALSAGSESAAGTWTLTLADLPGLGLRLPTYADGDFILGIAVTRAGEVVTSGSLVVTVDGSLPAAPGTPPDPEPAPMSGPAPAPEPFPEAPPETPQETQGEEEEGDVFVFGAGQGGDYAPGADGWSETAAPEESPNDADGEAITVAKGDEMTIEGSEKLEW